MNLDEMIREGGWEMRGGIGVVSGPGPSVHLELRDERLRIQFGYIDLQVPLSRTHASFDLAIIDIMHEGPSPMRTEMSIWNRSLRRKLVAAERQRKEEVWARAEAENLERRWRTPTDLV